MKLKDKVSLVTGGGKGIGGGICLSLAREGADIVVNFNQSQKQAEDVVARVKKVGRQAVAIRADVSKKEEVDQMIDEALSRFGRIDVLVNNAAITPPSHSFLELKEEIWDRTIDINLKGVFLCSQRVAREMIKQNIKGKIINISSVCGFLVQRGLVHYNASKSGLNSMTKTMCLELSPYGITVNCIAPGAVEVDRTRDGLRDPSCSEKWQNIIPVGRWGQPEDIGRVVVFLASDDASFISGETIYVDGGQSVQLPQPEFFNSRNP